MRFVNFIRDSDDSEVSTLMSDQAMSELLFHDTPTPLEHHSSAGRETGLEYESGTRCIGVRNAKQLQSTTLDSITLKFKTERYM